MVTLKPLVFFGNERLATAVSTEALTLRALISEGYNLAAVISSHTRAVSRSHRELEIEEVAKQNRIPFLVPDRLEDISDEIRSFGANAGILVAFGKIIPQSIIDIFPKGIINIHPSLLPSYRGPTPVETAILDGLDVSGVSLMSLSAKMDAGEVYSQKKISLSGHETKQELADRMLQAGSNLLIENLPAILSGELEGKAQDDSSASYTRLISKDDGELDWAKPAAILEREVRAYAGWPKSRAKIFDKDVIVTKASVVESPDNGNLVIKAHESYLEIQELVAPSGRKMSGVEFTRGYKR